MEAFTYAPCTCILKRRVQRPLMERKVASFTGILKALDIELTNPRILLRLTELQGRCTWTGTPV